MICSLGSEGRSGKETGVDKRSERKALEEGKSKMSQCIHQEMGVQSGEGERGFRLQPQNIRSHVSGEGPMGVSCPGLEQHQQSVKAGPWL